MRKPQKKSRKELTPEKKEEQKQKNRASSLMRTYGITIEQYDQMLKDQKGCCAVCERHESEFAKRLAVDHDHVSGEIRGLLCTYCNRYMVGRHRDPERVLKIYEYLLRHTGWFVPPKKRKKRRKKK